MNQVYIYMNEDGTLDGWGDGYSENAILVDFDPESDLFKHTNNYKYVDGVFIEDTVRMEAIRVRDELLRKRQEFQAALDYINPLINRHRDEIELGDPTTLTTEEYRALLRQRNEAVTFLNNNPI